MASDDDILRDYEHELGSIPVPVNNRKFWLVLGAILVASAFMLVEIFANLGIKESIAHAEDTLRRTQVAAEAIAARDGSLDAANPTALAAALQDLTFVGADQPSAGLDEVSIAAGVDAWAAAVQVRPGACFYTRIESDTVTYGAGITCTGRQGLLAEDSQW